MKKLIIAVALLTLGYFAFMRLLLTPTYDYRTFVETPDSFRELRTELGETKSDRFRVTPRVDTTKPESVIHWPAYKDATHSVPILVLRVRQDQWSDKIPVSDDGYIAPGVISLKLPWAPPATVGNEPEDLESLRVSLHRGWAGRKDKRFEESAGFDAYLLSPPGTPREEAVLVYCGYKNSGPCTLYFEFMGLPAILSFPVKWKSHWAEAHLAADQLLAEIVTVGEITK